MVEHVFNPMLQLYTKWNCETKYWHKNNVTAFPANIGNTAKELDSSPKPVSKPINATQHKFQVATDCIDILLSTNIENALSRCSSKIRNIVTDTKERT